MFQMLCQLVRKLRTMLIICIFVVPDDCTAAFFDYGTVYILTVLGHDLPNSLHPLLIMDFEELIPLFLVLHEPIATFGSQPKVFQLH